MSELRKHRCEFCTWSGPINRYPEHLPECDGTDKAFRDGAAQKAGGGV